MPITTREEIGEWFDLGVEIMKADFMIVVRDTFDGECYPVYANRDDYWAKHEEHDGKNMQQIVESYKLSESKAMQLAREHNFIAPIVDHRWFDETD